MCSGAATGVPLLPPLLFHPGCSCVLLWRHEVCQCGSPGVPEAWAQWGSPQLLCCGGLRGRGRLHVEHAGFPPEAGHLGGVEGALKISAACSCVLTHCTKLKLATRFPQLLLSLCPERPKSSCILHTRPRRDPPVPQRALPWSPAVFLLAVPPLLPTATTKPHVKDCVPAEHGNCLQLHVGVSGVNRNEPVGLSPAILHFPLSFQHEHMGVGGAGNMNQKEAKVCSGVLAFNKAAGKTVGMGFSVNWTCYLGVPAGSLKLIHGTGSARDGCKWAGGLGRCVLVGFHSCTHHNDS